MKNLKAVLTSLLLIVVLNSFAQSQERKVEKFIKETNLEVNSETKSLPIIYVNSFDIEYNNDSIYFVVDDLKIKVKFDNHDTEIVVSDGVKTIESIYMLDGDLVATTSYIKNGEDVNLSTFSYCVEKKSYIFSTYDILSH